jgi:hypothetical protein
MARHIWSLPYHLLRDYFFFPPNGRGGRLGAGLGVRPQAVKFGEYSRDRRQNSRLNRFRKATAQFRALGNYTHEQNFAGALPAQLGEKQCLDKGGIMRADTLRYGNADQLVFAVEHNIVWKFVTRFEDFQNERTDSVVAHQDVTNAEDADP